jgi:hypothetical protein
LALDPSGAPYLDQYVSATNPSDGSTYSQLHITRWSTIWQQVGATTNGLDAVGSNASQASLAVSNSGQIYVAWVSERSVYARTFNGSAWVEIGPGSAAGSGLSGVIGNTIVSVMLRLTDSGKPMVLWINRAPSSSDFHYFKAWNGASWEEYAGSGAGLGLGSASRASLAVDGEQPVVAYRTGVDVVVKKWNGTTWLNLKSGASDETPAITGTGTDRPIVVVPRPNTAVVAYRQTQTGGAAMAASYLEDGVWRPLGTSGGALSVTDSTFFGLSAASGGSRACITWRQGAPTSAYIACAKF